MQIQIRNLEARKTLGVAAIRSIFLEWNGWNFQSSIFGDFGGIFGL